MTTAERQLVVVGSDGSPAGQAAVDFAVREAVLRGAKLLVVAAYALPVTSYPTPMVWLSDFGPELAEATRTGAQNSLDLALERAGHPDLTGTVEVDEGRPAAVLLACAAEAQLLVVGARGLGMWGRLAMGSTSTEVIHHATIPVVVVPDIQVPADAMATASGTATSAQRPSVVVTSPTLV